MGALQFWGKIGKKRFKRGACGGFSEGAVGMNTRGTVEIERPVGAGVSY